MAKKKKITKKYLESNFYFFDKVTYSKGTFRFRKGYFYRMGMSDEDWGKLVVAELKKGGIKAKVVNTKDNWQRWPKDSYFVAEVRIGEDYE